METKQKTLDDCKDQVARSRAYKDWQAMYEMELRINTGAWTFLLKCTEEAAELYASEENRKKDEPKQSDVEREFEDFWDFAYSEHDLTTSDHEFDTIDYETCGKIFKAGFLANKSQRPFSIQWLSEEDIQKESKIGYENDTKGSLDFQLGMKAAQNELKKRVNAVDEKQILIGFCGWLFGGLCSETEQRIVNDYLNTK